MKFYSTKVKSIRHLRALSKKLGKMVENGSFYQLGKEKQIELKNRLANLYRETRAVFSSARLRRILASSAVLLGLAFSVQAQSFAAPVTFTSGLVQDGVPVYHFADIDGDGDQDAFMSVYGDSTRVLRYQENTGSATVAAFGDATSNLFGVAISANTLPTTVDFADVDMDGDLDLFIGTYNMDTGSAPILGWENTGTGMAPVFSLSPATNPFNFQPSEEFSEIAFADLDGDGDPDVLMNDYQETNDFEQFKYQKNLGVMPTFPVFEDPIVNAFGLSNTNVETFVMSFDDIDNDGDQDLIIAGNEGLYGAGNSAFNYYENTGTSTAPAFAASVANPFDLEVPANADILIPDLVDIDGDGDVDIIATVYSEDTEISAVYFWENLGDVSSAKDITAVSQLSVYPTIADQVINWEAQSVETIGNSSLRIVDVHGRLMNSETLDINTGLNKGEVQVADLTTGMYILHIADERGNTLANHRFFVK